MHARMPVECYGQRTTTAIRQHGDRNPPDFAFGSSPSSALSGSWSLINSMSEYVKTLTEGLGWE
jgi:hypothetical protein